MKSLGFAPVRSVLHLFSPALLVTAVATVVLGQMLAPTSIFATALGLTMFPIATAAVGVSVALATDQLGRQPDRSTDNIAFWQGAIPASLGLLVPLWWLLHGRHLPDTETNPPSPGDPASRPTPAPPPERTTSEPRPQVFRPVPPECTPTVLVGPTYPLASRKAAEFAPIRVPLQPLPSGTLAPTQHWRRRRAAPPTSPRRPTGEGLQQSGGHRTTDRSQE